jgi:hypothetical protein
MTEDEFDELCDRLVDKLGYDPKTFMRELVVRGAKCIEMTPAEMIALAGGDISEIAAEDGSGSVTIRPDDPAWREQTDAFLQGLRTDWRAGMDRALREWATEECVL